MKSTQMNYSHILITRPRQEALELADLLAPTQAEIIILPAHTFHAVKLRPDQVAQLQTGLAQPGPGLLIFTSPRAVEFGLSQLPPDAVRRARIAAIGPATAALLQQAGIEVSIQPRQGYTSEDLIKELVLAPPGAGMAATVFVLAAPGGRTLIRDSLQAIGYSAHTLVVYESKPAALDAVALSAIEQARFILSVWTSANAMTALAQRVPAACWRQLRTGEWLVISDRLVELARSYNPAKIHTSCGPANKDIAAAVRTLFLPRSKTVLPRAHG